SLFRRSLSIISRIVPGWVILPDVCEMGDTERPSQHEPAGPIVFTRAAHSLGVIVAQKNLGDALRASGEQQSGIAELEQAVSAYDEALQELKGPRPKRAPLWGQVHLQKAIA